MAIKKVTLNAIHHFLLLCTITMMGSFHGADSNSITQGQELADWQNLVSANGIFKLGFFSPGVSKNRYLGIWYNNVPEITSVWVGNRDAPVMDSSGALRIDANGSLIITQGGEIRYRVFNSSQTVSNLTATLLDSGNFVLAESATKRILWESFDYPSDSLLPGMKLGLKLKSDLKWSISPWTSDQVPAPGAFTLGVDPNRTTELYMWRRGEVYWTSGLWNNRSFNNVPQFTSNDKFVFRFVSNEEELYFTYTITDNSTISRWVINLWGQIHLYVWEGSSWNSIQNGLISPCEGNSTGCLEVKRNECRSGDEQFKKIKGDGFSGNIYLEDSTLSLNDCDFMCRRNCSCFAYALAYDNGTGCRFWGTGQSLSGDGGSTDIYTLSSNGVGSKKKWWIWFIVAVAVALPVLILGYFCHLCRKNLRHKGETEINQENMLLELGSSSTPSHESRDVNMFEKDLKKGNELQLFSFASIVAATDDFSSENKLGEGGFGPVYKGKLRGGKEIAVKRLSKSSGQGQEEFKNEISLIAKLQHMNLVRLFGCCIQGKEKMLIYEYMPNKSLDSFIFDPDKRALLDWKKRFNIIEGIAQGLLYLHKYSRLKVIHRDLKASNILLDDEMNPKISDFGMARIFGQNESENTTRVVGTYGYMSPEYAMSGIFSVKSDVFSFGVLLLEILSGRRNTSFNHSNKHVNLIGYVWEFWKEGTVLEIMDPTLGDSCPKNKLLRWIHVGLLCVQESATDRPTMSTVVSLLGNEKLHLHAPNQPAFSALKRGANTKSSEGRSDSCSQNDVTMSIVEAR